MTQPTSAAHHQTESSWMSKIHLCVTDGVQQVAGASCAGRPSASPSSRRCGGGRACPRRAIGSGSHVVRHVGDELVPPDVAVVLPGHRVAGAPVARRRARRSGAAATAMVGVRLQRHLAALAPALVLGDQDRRPGVAQALGERLGGEPAEDDDVGRADPGAGEHRDRRAPGPCPCRSRRGRPCSTPSSLQAVREPADLPQQLGVGDVARLARAPRRPSGRRPWSPRPGLDVPVEAVVGDVEHAVREPRAVRRRPLEPLRRLASNQSMNSPASRDQNPSKSSSASR